MRVANILHPAVWRRITVVRASFPRWFASKVPLRGRGPLSHDLACLAKWSSIFARRRQQTRTQRKLYAARHALPSLTYRIVAYTAQSLVAERRVNSYVFRHSSSRMEHPHDLHHQYVPRSIVSEVHAMKMEFDPLHTTPPLGLPASRTRNTGRSPTLRQGRTPMDQKLRRTTVRPVGDTEGGQATTVEGATPCRSATTKTYQHTAAQPKSLLPLTERRSEEDKTPSRKFTNASHEDAHLDIAPDGGSAGREGRQFAVWNVGNNGRIYLRYVVGYKSRGPPRKDQ